MAYSNKHRRRRQKKKGRARKKLHPPPVSAKQHYVLEQANRLVLTPNATVPDVPQQVLVTLLTGHNVSGVPQSFTGFPHVGDWMIIFLLSGYTSSSLIRDYLFYVKKMKHWLQVTNQTNVPVKVTVWRHRLKFDTQADSTAFAPVSTLEGCLTSEGMPVPAAGLRTTTRNLTFKDSVTFKEYFTAKICKTKLLQAGETVSCTYLNKKAVGFLHSSYYGNNLSSQPTAFTSKKYTHFWTVQVNPILTGDATTANNMEVPKALVFAETKDTIDWYMTAGNQLAETNYQFAGIGQNATASSAAWINPFTGTQQPVITVN